jgi:hypothetical protein
MGRARAPAVFFLAAPEAQMLARRMAFAFPQEGSQTSGRADLVNSPSGTLRWRKI